MSLKVTLEEQARIFDVKIGSNVIGKVTSYVDDPDMDVEDQYLAELFVPGEEDEVEVGWYKTIHEAGEAVVEWNHGPNKINKVIEKKA